MKSSAPGLREPGLWFVRSSPKRPKGRHVHASFRGKAQGRAGRDRHHPLRRRLRRRHAAHRHRVHARERARRQRPRHLPGLPRGDPRPRRLAVRRLGLPGELRLARDPHPRRRARRARGDEPGRAQDEPRRPEAGRHADREHRRLHAGQPREGRLQDEPARGRRPQADLQDRPRRHEQAHRDRARGLGAVVEGGGPLQELLRARPHVLALQPPDRAAARGDPAEVREEAGVRRRERERLQGRPRLRRDVRGVLPALRGPEVASSPRAPTAA